MFGMYTLKKVNIWIMGSNPIRVSLLLWEGLSRFLFYQQFYRLIFLLILFQKNFMKNVYKTIKIPQK